MPYTVDREELGPRPFAVYQLHADGTRTCVKAGLMRSTAENLAKELRRAERAATPAATPPQISRYLTNSWGTV